MDKTTLLRPRLSEKAYAQSELQRTYAVQVPADANKLSVASAIKAQFDVTVTDVRILNVKGKRKRTVRKGGRPTMGKRSDVKKAYVTLKEGDKLPFFATEADDKAKKADKKAEKKTAKKEKETK
jgi:large subunit ribosomal protein L23